MGQGVRLRLSMHGIDAEAGRIRQAYAIAAAGPFKLLQLGRSLKSGKRLQVLPLSDAKAHADEAGFLRFPDDIAKW